MVVKLSGLCAQHVYESKFRYGKTRYGFTVPWQRYHGESPFKCKTFLYYSIEGGCFARRIENVVIGGSRCKLVSS